MQDALLSACRPTFQPTLPRRLLKDSFMIDLVISGRVEAAVFLRVYYFGGVIDLRFLERRRCLPVVFVASLSSAYVPVHFVRGTWCCLCIRHLAKNLLDVVRIVWRCQGEGEVKNSEDIH